MTLTIPKGRHNARAWDLLRAAFGYLTAGFSGPLSGTVTVTQGMLDAVRWTEPGCPGDASKILGRTSSLLTLNPRKGSERLVWRPHPRYAGSVQFGYMAEDAAGFSFDWQPEPYAPGEDFHYDMHGQRGWPCWPYVGGDCPALTTCPVTVHADGATRRALTLLGVLAALIILTAVLL